MVRELLERVNETSISFVYLLELGNICRVGLGLGSMSMSQAAVQ